MMKNGLSHGSCFPCQNHYPDLVFLSFPDKRKALSFRKRYWRLKKNIWHLRAMGFTAFLTRKRTFVFPKRSAHQKRKNSSRERTSHGELDLQPGEWVEVRSVKEIFSTLDEHDKHKGLQFTKEMSPYCQRKFRVLKRVDKILIESTGELRTIKIPTVILDGVFCDGSSHGGCDRTCLCFWREIWLKRVTPAPPEK